LLCARTIHQCQGLTIDGFDFDPKGVRQHGRVYTSLSRVKDIKCLYLINKLEQRKFSLSNKVVNELQRIKQNASYELEYNLRSTKAIDKLTTCSLNTRSFLLHLEDIVFDYDLMNATLFVSKKQKQMSLCQIQILQENLIAHKCSICMEFIHIIKNIIVKN